MSPTRAVTVFCILALAFGQEFPAREDRQRLQPVRAERRAASPQRRGASPQRAKAGGFQCSPITAKGNASINLLDVAGDRSTTYFEVASSDAVRQWLSKGCTCGRSEFKYFRFGDMEKLFSNCFCDIPGQDRPARSSGFLIPVEDVSAQGLMNPIRINKDNQGQFAYIVMDVDDARLPQEIQENWKELREERLEVKLETLPEDVKQEIVNHPIFQRYFPDIKLEDITDKAVKKGEHKEERLMQRAEEEKPQASIRREARTPLRKLLQAREAEKPEESVGATQITEGPLLELDPEREGGIDLYEVHILEFDAEKKCMIVTAGCAEFVYILAAEPENITEDDMNKAMSRLEELGLNPQELGISRTEVSDQCVQAVKQIEDEEQRLAEGETARTEEEEQPREERTEEERPREVRKEVRREVRREVQPRRLEQERKAALPRRMPVRRD